MGGISKAEPTPSSSEYPKIISGRPCAKEASTAPVPYTARPHIKQTLRPQMSVSLLPGIISEAIVSVNRVIVVCMPTTVVPISSAIVLIATFMLLPA